MSFYTRIHRYAFDGDFEKMKELLSKFPDRVIGSDPLSNRTPLHYCSIKGHLRILKYIIENFGDCDLLSKKDVRGFTCLHYTSLNGHSKLLQHILQQEIIDVNESENVDGKTPLHLCVENDSPECFKLLLQYGANPKIKDSNGNTAEDLSQNKPRIKSAYESFLDGLFDIWQDKTQFSRKTRELEREQKQIAYPYFKFRLGIELDKGPGIRLVIKRLLSLNEGSHYFTEVCSNFLTKTYESKWRDFLKDIVCFSNKDERLIFVLKSFFKRVKNRDTAHVSDISIFYDLLCFCEPSVPYTFDFVERIWGTGSLCGMTFVLQELKEMSLCEVDFEQNFVRFNEPQARLLMKKRRIVRSYLSHRLGVKEVEVEDFFASYKSTVKTNCETPSLSTEPSSANRKKGKESKATIKKKVKKARKRKKKKSVGGGVVAASLPRLKLQDLGRVLLRNEFHSKLGFSRGYRIALVIGNSSYDQKKYKIDSKSSGYGDEDEVSLISAELIQNDCTAITCLLKNKLCFEVIHKKNLTGKGVNSEVHRILSIAKSLGGRQSGRPTILFVYLSGHLENSKFLGTDRKNELDENYLDLGRLYSEIEKSQCDKCDFCYVIMNPIPNLYEKATNQTSFLTRVPFGVPFQGVIASTTSLTPTLDSCFSKFSKHLCRFLEMGRLDIIKLFRKLRKKKVEVEFQSNFGNYSTSEMILAPYASENKTRPAPALDGPSLYEDDHPIPSVGGLQFGEGSETLEKLEFEIRDVKKKCGKSGFIIYHSTFSPPFLYEEKMMEKFKEAIEGNYVFEKGVFESRREEQSRLETSGENCELGGGQNIITTQEGLEKYILQKYKDNRRSEMKKGDDSQMMFRTPIVKRNISGGGLRTPQFLTPPHDDRRALLLSPSGRKKKKSTSVGKMRSRRNRMSLRTYDSLGKKKKMMKMNSTELSDEIACSNDDDGTHGSLGCAILRYIWVDFGNSILLTLMEKTEKVTRVNQKVRKAQKDIIKLSDCVDPTPFLLYVFRFLYVLFIRKMEEERSLFTRFKGLDEKKQCSVSKEDEINVERYPDDDGKKKSEEEEEENNDDEVGVDFARTNDDTNEGRSDLMKQEHAKKIWKAYSSLVWSEEFFEHQIYTYDFLIDGTGVLDQLEEIYENMKVVFQPKNEGKVEKLLFELVKTWVEFFEFKYIQAFGDVEEEGEEEKKKKKGEERSEKKEYLEIVTSKNPRIVMSKGSKIDNNNSTIPGYNREVVQSTFQMMVEYVRFSILSQTSINSAQDFCCFLGVTDDQFLKSDFGDVVRDIPLIIGCTSSEKRSLVEKKLGLVREYIHCYLRILIVDLFGKEDGASVDTSSVREEFERKTDDGEKRKGKKWGKGKTRK